MTDFTRRLKQVTRDGQLIWKLRCPGCETWAALDLDQFHGRVSVDCMTKGCSFHETHNFSEIIGESQQ